MDGGESFRRIEQESYLYRGFHKDGISAEEIREVQESVGRLTECVIRRLQV